MKSIRKWSVLLLAGSLAGGLLLLLIVSAAGAVLDEVSGIFGGHHVAATRPGEAEVLPTTPGKATYVGADDTDTDFSRQVQNGMELLQNNNPFINGYAGLCELWVADVYTAAGLPISGTCCAYNHGVRTAQKDGAIPKGALIFSGIIPATGKLYENDHRASAFCDVCGHYAGHVAIYVGNGYVAGSQVPYYQSIDAWIEVYGYGGWARR